ncbi:DsrE/DsrF/DrsH-like family protein [Candidatus Solincola tengchongensis]|uniref:DsrE/DsrF/DrsH-like family protein n=1 Tax=Candidatus Solincola tengchongensis TaxID=2900693 RepID=UPI00257E565C|nr:DsrE/DsrF/DrsH-like family protein [Candidatus Solincola tengchongensis]
MGMQGENSAQERRDSATIVVFSGELDRALAAFNIATTAASMGMEVTMFFTFWGLNVVRRERGGGGRKTALQRMLGLMNRGGTRRLRLSRLNMMGGGRAAMKRLMRQFRMPSLEEMIAMARDLGVRFIACTTSMALMGLTEDDFIPEVEDFAGAATYVERASNSSINLFI